MPIVVCTLCVYFCLMSFTAPSFPRPFCLSKGTGLMAGDVEHLDGKRNHSALGWRLVWFYFWSLSHHTYNNYNVCPPIFCNESFMQFFIQIVFVAFNFSLAWVFASHEGPISLLGKSVAVIWVKVCFHYHNGTHRWFWK